MLTRPDPVQPKRPNLSAPVRRRLAFRFESFHAIAREVLPLFQEHWQELALDRDFIPLDPDWDTYYNLQLQDKLLILTAREKEVMRCDSMAVARGRSAYSISAKPFRKEVMPLDRPEDQDGSDGRRYVGPLAGYVFNLVGGHLHYNSTRFAHTEMFWLAPEFRQGWEGVRMLKANLSGLRKREVEVATINFKLGFKNARVGKILARLGYQPTDIVMRKVL